ncbi:MAG TPA: hypothetical protein VJW20_09980 [Candidatus Angelobacter sp.]|nr:hypothetical protein [Candidatus Angelobacter sp.]
MAAIRDRSPQDPNTSRQESAQQDFSTAAAERWRKLGKELQADVAQFNSRQPGGEFGQNGENAFRVTNSNSSLELLLTADFENHTVRYEYSALNHGAGVPEGGMLSMRQSSTGSVEFYSADERLTSEETRQVLLEPMLFPKKP